MILVGILGASIGAFIYLNSDNQIFINKEDTSITFIPKEMDEVLLNPDMGWILLDSAIEYREDLGKSGDYPLVQTVGVLTAWGELEPEEGVYNWERLDNMIEYWVSKGKRINFRISTEDFPYLGVITGCPEWVYDYGVPKYDILAEKTLSFYPDYHHPIYREKLEKFLKVFSDRYGEMEALDTVDLRGYGRWGEWHSGYVYETWNERIEALQYLFDVWYMAWHDKKPLYLSYSHEWLSDVSNEDPPQSYHEYLQYSVFDYAFLKSDLNFRRDGVTIAITDNEREFCEEIYHDGRLQISEFGRQYNHYLEDGTLQQALDEGLELHPNYMVLIGWDGNGTAKEFYEGSPELVEYGLKNMGYRLYPRSIKYPTKIKKNSPLTISHTWENTAVGVCPKEYTQKFYLYNEKTKETHEYFVEDFNPQYLKKGELISFITEIDTSTIGKGTYTIKYAILDKKENPILLPVEGKDDNGLYVIGKVKIG